MIGGIERCPHCVFTQMVAMTNGWGGAFLTCLDCGYSDPVVRKSDPFPSRVHYSIDENGKRKKRVRTTLVAHQPYVSPKRRRKAS